MPTRVTTERRKNFIGKKIPELTESVWGTRTYTPTYVRTYTYVCVLLTTLPSDTIVLERGGDSFSSLNYYLHTIRTKNTPVKLPWIRLYWSNFLDRRQLNFNCHRWQKTRMMSCTRCWPMGFIGSVRRENHYQVIIAQASKVWPSTHPCMYLLLWWMSSFRLLRSRIHSSRTSPPRQKGQL